MTQQRTCNTVEAKARLNELLNEVAAGCEITIQRRGRPVARLIPAAEHTPNDTQRTTHLMQRLRRFHRRLAKSHGVKGQTRALLRALRDES